MKTSIKSIIALSVTTLVLSLSALKLNAAQPTQMTVLKQLNKVNKINLSGNVELIIVQSADESVKVYDQYFSKNALIQEKNGELRVSSFEKETLTVVVYVSDLTSVTASNNSKVKTYGKFNALSLDIDLYDQATVELNTNTITLYANLNGQSKLTLTGTAEEYNALMGSITTVNMLSFTTQSTNIKSKSTRVAQIKDADVKSKLEELLKLENS